MILAIDDTPANLKLIRVLLSLEGYEVLTAPDAESGLAIILNSRPDVIVTDIQLPGMDGLRLIQRLKTDPATRGIPIIALTAYAMKGDELKARQAGCDAYMTKPIDTRAFPAIVGRYVRAIVGAAARGAAS